MSHGGYHAVGDDDGAVGTPREDLYSPVASEPTVAASQPRRGFNLKPSKIDGSPTKTQAAPQPPVRRVPQRTREEHQPVRPSHPEVPPGAPPGGHWAKQKHCGPLSICLGILCWCSLCCGPHDEREVYVAPNGVQYAVDGMLPDSRN
jgi:hypothetical protein